MRDYGPQESFPYRPIPHRSGAFRDSAVPPLQGPMQEVLWIAPAHNDPVIAYAAAIFQPTDAQVAQAKQGCARQHQCPRVLCKAVLKSD
jgi:hypothetical protein